MTEGLGKGLSLRFVNAHYAPDVAATGEFLTDLAEGLVRRGHRVQVVTGRSTYGAEAEGLPDESVRNGVRVTRVPSSDQGRGRTLGRLRDYATFLLGAAGPATAAGADLTIYLTTPPLAGLLGWSARRRTRYGLWVMDLHPEAEIAHGMISPDGLAARTLTRLDRAVFTHSSLTVALGRCMEERIREKVPQAAPEVIRLWRDPGEVTPLSRAENPLSQRWDVGDRFVVMYSGNAGLAHRFDEICELMRRWRHDPEVLFLFIGGGARRRELEAFIREEPIPNARYLDYVRRDQVAWTLPLADVHLISLEAAWSGIAVPSKLFGIMAAGRPALMVGPRESETARILSEAGMGTVVDPDRDPDPAGRLVEAATALRHDADGRRTQGRRARAALEAGYTRVIGVDRWDKLLRSRLQNASDLHGAGSPTSL